MKRSRVACSVIVALAGMTLVAACIGACGENRERFDEPPIVELPPPSGDASDCRLQCSLDGRTVIESCTGNVIETCSDDLACGAGKCQEPCAAAAADGSSNGCEFYFQPPPFNPSFAPSCFASYVVNTSVKPVDLSLELGGEPLDVSKSMFRMTSGTAALTQHTGPIAPGEGVVLFVSDLPPDFPLDPLQVGLELYRRCPAGVVPAMFTEPVTGTRMGSSFHLKTNVPIGLAAIYPFGGAASHWPTAMLLLPVTTWGKEHMLVNGWEVGSDGSPSAQIVASEDDTEVTIVPRHDIQAGNGVRGARAGRSAKYRLDRGQFLQLVQDYELTGSVVSSTKPTTVFGGNSCADIPTMAGACDILQQQIPALEQWGSEYVGVGYRPRRGNEHEPVLYRIVAARDGTLFDYDPEIPPGAPTIMNAGEVAMFRVGTGDAFTVRTQDAEHPIYVAAHMTGADGDSRTIPSQAAYGDPEFVNVIPSGQYLNSYAFYADPTYYETSLVVVRAKLRGEFKDVWLECAGDLTDWKPVGTRGEYEYVRVDLSLRGKPGATFGTSACHYGLQRMRSEGPFTATLWGWDFYASYAYPGGMAQRKLVDWTLAH
jgi:IgGFc binding protein